jgi:hypothetical protein
MKSSSRAQAPASLQQPGVFCREEQYRARLFQARPLPKRLARIVCYRRGVERPPHKSDHRGVAPDFGRPP